VERAPFIHGSMDAAGATPTSASETSTTPVEEGNGHEGTYTFWGLRFSIQWELPLSVTD
jgi:hypothetical protein